MVKALLEGSQCLVVPAEAAQRVALAFPGGHIIRPRARAASSKGSATLAPSAPSRHRATPRSRSTCGSLLGIHPLAVENDQVRLSRPVFPGLAVDGFPPPCVTGMR